jgi:Delta3-Delta2-enoyl-CoA isomerase
MTDIGRIGLNEVELGIPVPKFWAALMARVVGQGVADKLCGFAQMSTPQQALNVGMIDEVVATGQLLSVSSLS